MNFKLKKKYNYSGNIRNTAFSCSLGVMVKKETVIKTTLIILIFIFLAHICEAQKIFKVEYESQADLKVYTVKYKSQADLKIFYVDYESQAGWRNKEKMYLLKFK